MSFQPLAGISLGLSAWRPRSPPTLVSFIEALSTRRRRWLIPYRRHRAEGTTPSGESVLHLADDVLGELRELLGDGVLGHRQRHALARRPGPVEVLALGAVELGDGV